MPRYASVQINPQQWKFEWSILTQGSSVVTSNLQEDVVNNKLSGQNHLRFFDWGHRLFSLQTPLFLPPMSPQRPSIVFTSSTTIVLTVPAHRWRLHSVNSARTENEPVNFLSEIWLNLTGRLTSCLIQMFLPRLSGKFSASKHAFQELLSSSLTPGALLFPWLDSY